MLAALPALALAAPPLPGFQRPAPEGPGAPPSAPRPGRRGDPGRRLAGRWAAANRARLLGLGTAVFLVPSLLTGAGNLGAARNWDLFAAPSVAPALCGILLVTDRLGGREKRRLLLGLVAVSLFHTVPWVALNADFDRTVERITALPLGLARGETLLGTYHLNRGELGQAERWFRRRPRPRQPQRSPR